jgi:septal ring factor EnvC (AmiA/AmiB activator)
VLSLAKSLFVLLFLLPAAGVIAQSRQTLEEQRKKTLNEIDEINGFLKETQQTQKESLNKIILLNSQIKQYTLLISNTEKEIKLAGRQIDETLLQVKKLSNEVEKLKDEYAQMVFHAYKNKGKYDKLVYILSAKDFNEAYRRMKYFQQYSQFRAKQVSEITESRQQLDAVIKKLAQQKAQKEKLMTTQQKEFRQLEAVKGEQNEAIERLKSQEKKLRQQIAEKQREAQKLQQTINRMIAAEVKKNKGAAKTLYDRLTPSERLVSDNFNDNKGLLPWPTERGIITGFFGVNSDPLYKDIKINNSGIDITTVGNSEVRAIFEGVVTMISRIHGGNIAIMIRHGNFISVYANLVDISVKQGDNVKAKTVIGRVYTEKGMKTSILHFEIWEETNNMDPELWLVKK